MNVSYNLGIPNGPNNPSNDQPLMQTNTNNIATLIAIDHVGFATNKGGFHKQVHLINEAAPGLGGPPNNADAVLFSNTNLPFWQNASGVNQLAFVGSSSIVNNGFITLPGGLKFIWASQTLDNNGNPIQDESPFVFPGGGFTNCFNVFFNAQKSSRGAEGLWIKTGTLSLTGFTIKTSASAGQLSPFYYFAMGN